LLYVIAAFANLFVSFIARSRLATANSISLSAFSFAVGFRSILYIIV
jgi:hypothetical protein